MKLDEMYPSIWLGQADVPSPIVVTIREVKREAIKSQRGTEVKNIINFTENVKAWILNKGNAKRIAALYGDDTTNWVGKKIEIYTDPMVEFSGEVVGGLRLRAPTGPAPTSNGHPASFPGGHSPAGRWDISDGQMVRVNITTDEARQIINGSGADPKRFRVKPAGAPNGEARTADQWGFVNGQTCEADDPIPF